MTPILTFLACLTPFPEKQGEQYPENPAHDFDQDGYTEEQGDCNDEDATVYPEASEFCDSQDNDCDGLIDDDPIDATAFYLDSDNDGVGQANFTITECEAPNGYIELVTDDNGEVLDDCDDDDRFINPLAQEICDSKDNDCDLLIDDEDEDLAGEAYWYPDSDRDLFPSPDGQVTSCTQPTGYVQGEETLPTELIDCNDSDPQINPSAPEICDSFDNDCDGLIDDDDIDDPVDRIWTVDSDGDGFGDATSGAETVDSCQPVEGYAAVATDCDDNNYAINPEAEEVCDEIDQNCNGQTDEGVKVPWYLDEDGDGFGANPSVMSPIQDCPNSNPPGYVSNFEDCDDTDATIAPSPTWYLDGDGDGYGSPAYPIGSCVAPSGYVADAGDCDDSKGNVNPSKQEDCLTTFDDNCDGDVNSPNALSCSDFFLDADDDGFGVDGDTACICSPDDTTQYRATIGGDCDDTRNAVKPSTTNAVVLEDCDTVYDDNCNGDLNETAAANCANHFLDADGDGFGTADYLCMCSVNGDYTLTYQNQVDEDNRQIDCNDASALISPAAQEVCDDNDIDEDCSGVADDAAAPGSVNWFRDGDGDGYGTTTDTLDQCDQPTGYILQDGDCDDANPALNPGEVEICVLDPLTNLHRDEDCSGSDNDPDINAYNGGTLYYADVDNDGYGTTGDTHYGCYPDGTYTAVLDGDCDDGDNAINPNRAEVCATADDEDCDGLVDEDGALDCTTYYKDVDNDGFGLGDDSICSCEADGDYRASIGSDCNDGDALVNSGLGNCGLMGSIPASDATYSINSSNISGIIAVEGGKFTGSNYFDYNHDGIPDVATWNENYDPVIGNNQYIKAGAAYIHLGPFDGDLSAANADVTVVSNLASDNIKVRWVGNMDNDPADEVLLFGDYSGYRILDSGLSGFGQVDIDHGLVSDEIDFSQVLFGENPENYSPVGDLNHDGIVDFRYNLSFVFSSDTDGDNVIDAVGSQVRLLNIDAASNSMTVDFYGNGQNHFAYVDPQLNHTFHLLMFDSNSSLVSDTTFLDNTPGHFNLYGSQVWGWGRSTVGDFSGDGITDIVTFDAYLRTYYDQYIGNILYAGFGCMYTGNVVQGVYIFPTYTSAPTWCVRGDYDGKIALTGIIPSDLNGDGIQDLIVGHGGSNGRYHVFYGPLVMPTDSDGNPRVATIADADTTFTSNIGSIRIVPLGDINQDGMEDLLYSSGSNLLVYFGQPN